jgi:hypothetical protein
MNDTNKRILEIIQKISDLSAEKNTLMESMFTETAKKIFEEFPTLLYFGWTQYTPYFNDGDPCEFGVNTSYPFARFDGEDDERGIDEELGYGGHELLESKLSAFLDGFDEDFFHETFGDHAKVVVYADGRTEVKEYEHD